jgi:glycosyltransferase involved in cell wall biosynthesis
LPAAGVPLTGLPPCSWQTSLGRARPGATVCIATCGVSIPRLLATVRSALDQSYDNTQVLVVDNRPGTTELPGPLDEAFSREERLRYVAEPRPGLAVVRNRSAREARTEIVALTDDDVSLDPDWLGFLVAGFDREEVACVTGLILPSQLETPAQLLIEEFGGFSKGFERRRWDLDRYRLDHPLYPYLLGVYGSGANAAWRRTVLQDIGGYDARLGTGTRTRGGEDLDAYLTCIQSAHQLVYEPAAIVRHEHRRDAGQLKRQVFDYGVGLGAVLTKRFLRREERSEMIARLPAGLFYLLDPGSPKNAGKTKNFPRSLTLVELAGIAYGPITYLRSRGDR